MDTQTILFRLRGRKIAELNAKLKTTDFAYRDEYGRYRQEESGGPGIGGVAAVGAVGGGLYARGRMSGAIGPSGVERRISGLRERMANSREGVTGRQTGTVNGGMSRAAGVREQASRVGREARTAYRGAKTGVSGVFQGTDRVTGPDASLVKKVRRAGRISRGGLRSFLTRTSKALARGA